MKKAISAATSAALLASLLATAVAPSAFASSTVTGVGTVPRGGTSATAATFLFTESDVNTLTTAGGAFSVYIFSNGADCNDTLAANIAGGFATVHFTGTGTQVGPGSLGLDPLVVGDNFFTVTTTDADTLNVETISIGGLMIKADTTAATGAIVACVYNQVNNIFTDAFATGTTTATGKLASATGVNATQFFIALDVGSCEFTSLPSGTLGPIKIGTDSVTTATVSALSATVVGQQDVTLADPPLAVTHGANDVVTEKVNNCNNTTIGSPGTVADSLKYNDPGTPTRVNPGESNQGPVVNLSATERTAGFLVAAATITLTITTPGVTFSNAPNLDVTVGDLIVKGTATGTSNIFGILSADRMSVTWTVDTKSTVASTIVFDDIMYDVAASVATGTAINVTLATSAGVVVPTSRSNAVVGRVLTVTSTAPIVYVGENNQTAGQVTILETGAGFFTDGTGNNNAFSICLFTGEQFAAAPWAKVTAGDLRLREGTTSSTDNVVQGSAITVAGIPFACYYWTVWTASTAASTVLISGDEAGTLGVKINVPAGMGLGPVDASVRTGSVATMFNPFVFEGRTVIANRMFRNQVVVTALSQPVIPTGATNSLAGDIQIQETANGQLKFGERVCFEVLPRTSAEWIQDTFLKGLTTADMPVATASNGVVISGITLSTQRCDTTSSNPSNTLLVSFSFFIQQQSITGNGKVVVSNIHYGTTADAPIGNVLVNVFGYGISNTQVDLQALVSNAKIGVSPKLNIGAVSALGRNPTSGYTNKTPKTQAKGKYVTWKFTGGHTLAGQRVNVLWAKKVNGAWGGPVYLKSAWADANGIVTFSMKSATAAAANIRVQWPGNTAWAVSVSKALGAYWK